jgi:predicted PurR-regulated permease PerM
MGDEKIGEKKIVALFVIAILAILAFVIAKPFILTIVSSMVLAYIVSPLHIKLKKIVRNSSLSAAVLSIAVILLIALPVWFLVPNIIRQTFSFYTMTQKIDFVTPLKHIAPKFFASPEFTRDFTVTINQIMSKGMDSIMHRFEEVIINLPLLFMQFAVMLFIFFFSLRDGEKIVEFLKGLSPLKEASERRFIQKFSDITKSVVYGMFIVGVIQGFFAGIGFYVFKAPQPLFLTMVAIFFGILPFIGTWAVWLPASIAFIVSGNLQAGMGLAGYSLISSAIIEVFIRPYIVKKQAKIPIATVLIGMLGGGYAFGIIGLIIGPLILEYFILFLEFYRTKNLHELFD